MPASLEHSHLLIYYNVDGIRPRSPCQNLRGTLPKPILDPIC
jgi:hypothetical protein